MSSGNKPLPEPMLTKFYVTTNWSPYGVTDELLFLVRCLYKELDSNGESLEYHTIFRVELPEICNWFFSEFPVPQFTPWSVVLALPVHWVRLLHRTQNIQENKLCWAVSIRTFKNAQYLWWSNQEPPICPMGRKQNQLTNKVILRKIIMWKIN